MKDLAAANIAIADGGFVPAPMDNADTAYRRLTSHAPTTNTFSGNTLPIPVPRLAGVFSQRRIASFDRRAIAAAKNLINQVSLPSADRLLDALTSFETALTWPEAQQRIQNVLQRGLQRDSDFETRWPEGLGTLLET